jgi:uncharacterized protein (DUF1800 family)
MRVSVWVATVRVCAAGVLTLQLAVPVEALAQAAAGAPQQPSAMQEGGDAGMAAGIPASQVRGEGLVARTAVAVIPQDQRYLLVLDRFTYGPRPGDVEKLQKMGLNAWFQQQMDPAKIDDSVLEAKLANYPAMQLPLNKLMEMYPSNGLIKQAMNGKAGMPGGEAERAIYADQEAQYKEKKAKEKAGKDGENAADMGPASLPEAPEEILAMPADKRFKELCHLTLAQLDALRKALTPEQRLQLVADFSPAQIEAIAAFNGPHNVVEAEDIQVKLLRDVYTERQLNEVMVDFWLNHFNVYMKKSQDAPYYITAYERAAIRPNALGKFENLLISTATSPAMLNYLDNSESVGPHSQYATGMVGFNRRVPAKPKQTGLNENYAREVMELHTVGVTGGYTQKDVTELAKVFTGWTVGKGFKQDVVSQAQYDPAKHEPGTKVVMGMTIKENGEKEGIEALKMLAASPQCARFISTKLAVRFVSDTPPPAMVDKMTQTFLETHGDIRKVLLAMVNSPEFFTEGTYRVKLKTPQEFVVSAVRAAGSDVESTAGMQQAVAELGMPLYGMQTPNGYSMKAEAWNSTTQLVSRMNFAMALASNRVAGMTTDAGTLLGSGAAGTAEEKTKSLEDALLHGPLSERTQKLILAQVTTDGAVQMSELKQVSAVNGKDPLRVGGLGRPKNGMEAMDTQASLAMGLILGSPEFQRR